MFLSQTKRKELSKPASRAGQHLSASRARVLWIQLWSPRPDFRCWAIGLDEAPRPPKILPSS